MNLQEATNRGRNFFVVGLLGVAGFSFLTDFFGESEWTGRVDELLLLALAFGAIWWYNSGRNKFNRSVVPILFMFGAITIKILGIFLELRHTEDLGDDYGALAFLIVAAVVVLWQYLKKDGIAG